MDPHLRTLASRQDDIVATWQLRAAGWSEDKVRHHQRSRGWTRVHAGVYALTSTPLDRRQLWRAAVLSAPGSVLSHGSAGACYGFYRFERPYEVITRPGRGGRRRQGALLIFRRSLQADLDRHTGIPITTAARALFDLAPGLDDKRLGRAFREAIRLKTTTAARALECAQRHGGRPGASRLAALATRYATLPYHRARSNPEARALEVLHDAGAAPPLVNSRIAGEEADLAWPDRRVIIEIDGPQYHRFRDEDARKAEVWRSAGYVVRRLPSDAVYDAPNELIARYEL